MLRQLSYEADLKAEENTNLGLFNCKQEYTKFGETENTRTGFDEKVQYQGSESLNS
jgi:hypothetical protein